MEPEITQARRTRGMKIAKLLPELPTMVNPGETPFLIGHTDTWLPALDGFILTNHRLLLTLGKAVTQTASWGEILGFQENPGKKGIIVNLGAGTQLNINRLPPPDHAALQAALEIFPNRRPDSDVWTSWQLRRQALDPSILPAFNIPSAASNNAGPPGHKMDFPSPPLSLAAATPAPEPHSSPLAVSPISEAPPGQPDPTWPATALPLGPPDTIASRTIEAYCFGEESPWLIVHTPEGATLAAFDDRLLVVKRSEFSCRLVTGHIGDWSSLFYFHDITDLEYGHEIQILTAGFQGLNLGRAPALHQGSPHPTTVDLSTISNTISVGPHELALCLPLLDELRQRIFEVVPSDDKEADDTPGKDSAPAPDSTPAADDIAGQIERLVTLQENGSLSDDHFAAALAKVLDG